jgi:hypothetical protein
LRGEAVNEQSDANEAGLLNDYEAAELAVGNPFANSSKANCVM